MKLTYERPRLIVKRVVRVGLALSFTIYIGTAERPEYILDLDSTDQSAGSNIHGCLDFIAPNQPSIRGGDPTDGGWKNVTVASSAMPMLLEVYSDKT